MKNLTKLTFIILTLAIIILSGCSDSFQEGTIAISLGEVAASSIMASGARAVYPPTPEMRVEMDYTITMQGPTGTLSPVVPKGATSVSVTVAAGTWTVTVNASYQGAPYASGTGSVNVRAGQNNPCIINMSPASAPPQDPTPGNVITFEDDDYVPLSLLDFGTTEFPAPAGYTVSDYERTLYVRNNGTDPTGTLNITTDNSNFVLSGSPITDIPAGDCAAITVTPRKPTGSALDVGTHTATITVSGDGISASINVRFIVTNRINIKDYDQSIYALQTAINNVLAVVDEVIVEGTEDYGSGTLTLNIPAGKTVTWAASYTSTQPISVAGAGKLIVTGSTSSLNVTATGNVIISGGMVTANSSTYAMTVSGKAVIRSGTITGTGNASEYPILVSGGKLAILGGTIFNPGASLFSGDDVFIYGSDFGVVYITNAAGISPGGISAVALNDCTGFYATGFGGLFNPGVFSSSTAIEDVPSNWDPIAQEWD